MYSHLVATSKTLRELLKDFMSRRLEGFAAGGSLDVTLQTPQEMTSSQASSEGLSLWLYRVARDEHRLNDPPIVRRQPDGSMEALPPPLPLRLHYLMTPLAKQPETEQLILGCVLQCFHATPIVMGPRLQGSLAGTEAEVHLRLEALGLEEITRVWEALEGSYQLAVSYEVSLVNIDSAARPEHLELVESVHTDSTLIVGVE